MKTSELKQLIKEQIRHILTEEDKNDNIKFADLLDRRLEIEIGSGTTTSRFNETDLKLHIKEAIKHNLMDWNFY